VFLIVECLLFLSVENIIIKLEELEKPEEVWYMANISQTPDVPYCYYKLVTEHN
jgi:hypothetical protein